MKSLLRFDEKSFFNTILGFSPYWDFKSFDEYFGEKFMKLSTIETVHLKCDCIDGNVVNGLGQLKLNSFVLHKPPGYKVFFEPERIHYKKYK